MHWSEYLPSCRGQRAGLWAAFVGAIVLVTGCLKEPRIRTCVDDPRDEVCQADAGNAPRQDATDGTPLDANPLDAARVDAALTPDAESLPDADVDSGRDAGVVTDAMGPLADAALPVCEPTGDEVCDGLDNDCDETVDEDASPFVDVRDAIVKPGLAFIPPIILPHNDGWVVAWVNDRRPLGQSIRLVFYAANGEEDAEFELGAQARFDEFNRIYDLAFTRTDDGRLFVFWVGGETNVAGGNDSYLRWIVFAADGAMQRIREQVFDRPVFYVAARGLARKVAVTVNYLPFADEETRGLFLGFLDDGDDVIQLREVDQNVLWHRPALVRRGDNGLILLWIQTEGNFGYSIVYSEFGDDESALSFAQIPNTSAASGLSAYEVAGGFAVAWSRTDGVRNDLEYDVYSGPPGLPLSSALADGPRSLVPSIPGTLAQGNFPMWPQLRGPLDDRSPSSVQLVWTQERLDTQEGPLSSVRYTRIRNWGADMPAWRHDPPTMISDGTVNTGPSSVGVADDSVTVVWHALGATGPAVGNTCARYPACNDDIDQRLCHHTLNILVPQGYACLVRTLMADPDGCNGSEANRCVTEGLTLSTTPIPEATGLVIKQGDLGCGRMTQ